MGLNHIFIVAFALYTTCDCGIRPYEHYGGDSCEDDNHGHHGNHDQYYGQHAYGGHGQQEYGKPKKSGIYPGGPGGFNSGQGGNRPGQDQGGFSQGLNQDQYPSAQDGFRTNQGQGGFRPGQNQEQGGLRPEQNQGEFDQGQGGFRPGQNQGQGGLRPGQNQEQGGFRPGQNQGQGELRPGQNQGQYPGGNNQGVNEPSLESIGELFNNNGISNSGFNSQNRPGFPNQSPSNLPIGVLPLVPAQKPGQQEEELRLDSRGNFTK